MPFMIMLSKNISSMTTARSKMLDKVERQDMQALNLNGDFHVHYPHDHL